MINLIVFKGKMANRVRRDRVFYQNESLDEIPVLEHPIEGCKCLPIVHENPAEVSVFRWELHLQFIFRLKVRRVALLNSRIRLVLKGKKTGGKKPFFKMFFFICLQASSGTTQCCSIVNGTEIASREKGYTFFITF
jgi:hypothetical protein